MDIVAKNIFDVDILDTNISPGTSINIDGSPFKIWQSDITGNCEFSLEGGGGITSGWQTGYHHLGGSFYCDDGQKIRILRNDIDIGGDQWTNYKGYYTLKGNSSITIGGRLDIYYGSFNLEGHITTTGKCYYVHFSHGTLTVERGGSVEFQGNADIGFSAGASM